MVPSEMKLLDMLSNNDVTFFVPPYQRNYEWTKEQCETFFDDIVKTYAKNLSGHKTEHFFVLSHTFRQKNLLDKLRNLFSLMDSRELLLRCSSCVL